MARRSTESTEVGTHPIEFEGITKSYGKRKVLDSLTFTVPRGSVVGLLGPNGAGKSTAMRVLLGLTKPDSGVARILGQKPGSPGFRGAVSKVGSIIESPPLFRNASALQNLDIRASALGLSVKDAEVREILGTVGLEERAEDKVGTFSLGMRQRVGLALALVGDPSIVVLDEPTNGLDPEGSWAIRDLIRNLPSRGATALVCTHRLAEIEMTCDYVVLLQKGKLVMQGTLAEITAAASGGGLSVTVKPEELQTAVMVMHRMGYDDAGVIDGAVRTKRAVVDSSLVTRALVEAGIFPSAIEPHHASLEEAFLEITNEDAEVAR